MKIQDLSNDELDAIEVHLLGESILPAFWESSVTSLDENNGNIKVTVEEIRNDHMFQAICKLEGINPEEYLADVKKNLIDYSNISRYGDGPR